MVKRILTLFLVSLLLCIDTSFSDVRIGNEANPSHITIGTLPIKKVYIGTDEVWNNTNLPNIVTFTVSPTTIDLDTRPTGNISLSWTATAQSNTQTSKLYLEPQGTRIGQTFVTGSGAGVSNTFSYTQPTATQIYRVVVNNSGGASHRDVTVTVTQNPQVSGFNYGVHLGGGIYQYSFSATITGLPRPTVSKHTPVSYTHLRAHETKANLVCRLLL